MDINESPVEDLIKIKHIGTRRATLIIQRRNETKFRDLYELSVTWTW